MISTNDLISKFRYALENDWGYIWGQAGDVWTQAKQNAATREQTKKYGQQWVGHHVADCSGLFRGRSSSWAGTCTTGRIRCLRSIRPRMAP